jgi:Fe-S oxidoreductase
MFVIAMGLFVPRMYFLWRLMCLGKKEDRFDRIVERIKRMVLVVLPQWCTLKSVTAKDFAGIGHALLFWGFSCFLASYVILIGLGEGLGLHGYIEGTVFDTVFLSVLDFAGLLVIFSVIWAAIRRYILQPPRLEVSVEAGFIMFMVFSLMVLHFCIEGFGMAALGETHGWPIISSAIASRLVAAGIQKSTLAAVSTAAWWLHYAMILVFTVYIPRSKHLHVLASAFNVLFQPLDRKVVFEPIPLEALESEEPPDLGVSKIQDLKWKDILDLYACAKCGRCHVTCPAQTSGKDLSPREFLRHMKDHLLEAGPALLDGGNGEAPAEGEGKSLVGDVVSENEIWACTTCGACQEVCPVNIEHIRKLLQFRQYLVLGLNQMPESAQLMLRNMQTRGNPWAGAQSLRLRGDWTGEVEGLKILGECEDNPSTLLWVGCTGALIERNVLATLALVKVLKAGGIDFAVLGEAESCCGDPTRRAGYEFQFQISAEENIETLKNFNIKEIITACPHCHNALKNEYPQYGADFKVVHYTEVVADLIRKGKLQLANEVSSLITYHDPCYLSRYNGVFEEPRSIIQLIPRARYKEMERSKTMTFCCGGGGGHMWIEEQHGTTKINHVRMDEVIKTGVDTVVTSCPYCLQMLEEGIEQKGVKDTLKAKDLIEVVEAAMKQS